MLHPVNNNDVAFKSGPWYANAISYVTRLDAFGPIVALEATVDTGRAVQAKKRGGKNEMRERMIEDITGGVVWLFGVKSLNALGDKILNKWYGGNFDVGTDKVLRTPFENFMKKNAGKNFAGNPKKVAIVKAIKVLTSVLLADSFIGLVLPKLNQKLTRTLIAKDKQETNQKQQKQQKVDSKTNTTQPVQNNNSSEVSFKGSGGLAAINVFTNAIENTNIGKLLSTDAGLISGRMYSARNSDERREIAIRDIGSTYFYMFAAVHAGMLLNLFESGHSSRLNPDSANIFNEHLTKFIEKNGDQMDVDKFKELVLGKNSADIKLPEGIKFETGKVSKISKLFNKNKEPLQVAKVSDLEKIFKDKKIMERIREMSKLQPLRQGEAVITKQQIIDAINVAEINNPELLKNIFSNYTGGKGKLLGYENNGKSVRLIRSKTEFVGGDYINEFKYVSNDKLYKLKADMETYVKDLCKSIKNGKVTKDTLNKFKNKNLILNGANFAAGFAVAALFLSTLIPKFQYWVTRKKTGQDAFPGTYGLVDPQDKQ